MRLFLFAMGVLLAGIGSARAQMQWTDFPPAQSRLGFDAPGLPGRPDRAFEGVDPGKRKVARYFGYQFSTIGGADAFAHVYVFSIAADQMYFTQVPDFDGLLPTLYPEFAQKPVAWTDDKRLQGPTPIGGLYYRRFAALGHGCVSFGGLIGVAASSPLIGGIASNGTEQILGYYCAVAGHNVSDADARLVLTRLSFDGLGKAQGPAPKTF